MLWDPTGLQPQDTMGMKQGLVLPFSSFGQLVGAPGSLWCLLWEFKGFMAADKGGEGGAGARAVSKIHRPSKPGDPPRASTAPWKIAVARLEVGICCMDLCGDLLRCVKSVYLYQPCARSFSVTSHCIVTE